MRRTALTAAVIVVVGLAAAVVVDRGAPAHGVPAYATVHPVARAAAHATPQRAVAPALPLGQACFVGVAQCSLRPCVQLVGGAGGAAVTGRCPPRLAPGVSSATMISKPGATRGLPFGGGLASALNQAELGLRHRLSARPPG